MRSGRRCEAGEVEREAYERLSKAYRVVHSLNKAHSCHYAHLTWRKEVFRMLYGKPCAREKIWREEA